MAGARSLWKAGMRIAHPVLRAVATQAGIPAGFEVGVLSFGCAWAAEVRFLEGVWRLASRPYLSVERRS